MSSVSMEIIEGHRCSTCGCYILTPGHSIPRECNYCKGKYDEAKHEQGLGEYSIETTDNKLRGATATNVGSRIQNDPNENGLHDLSDGLRFGDKQGGASKE